jgi:hypothetical protein
MNKDEQKKLRIWRYTTLNNYMYKTVTALEAKNLFQQIRLKYKYEIAQEFQKLFQIEMNPTDKIFYMKQDNGKKVIFLLMTKHYYDKWSKTNTYLRAIETDKLEEWREICH